MYIIISFAFLSFILGSCTLDNLDGPNAQITGAIRDSIDMTTLVEQDLVSGSTLQTYETSYATPTPYSWKIKEDGTYTNNLVFSNTYDFVLSNGNFFPYSAEGVVINQGNNTKDFFVYPYIRIKNPKIVLSQDKTTVTATFSLEEGKPGVKVNTVQLFAFSDIHVGNPIKFTLKGSNFQKKLNNLVIDPTITHTLSIDLTANSNLFKTGRNYFFRIGAIAGVLPIPATVSGTIRYNYAPNVKVTL